MRRSIRIGRAPYVIWPFRHPRSGTCYFLYANLPPCRAKRRPVVRMLKPVDPALFLGFRPIRSSSSPGTPRGSNSSRHALEPTPRAFLSDCSPRVRGIMRSTPQRYFSHSRQVPIGTFVKFALSGLFRPVLRPRNSLPNQADSSSFRSPPKAGGVVDSGALLGATGGTQTHSRRTGRKLGRLRYARQGLVRVPESNTKYGGQGGKTGGSAAPVIDPSIGES